MGNCARFVARPCSIALLLATALHNVHPPHCPKVIIRVTVTTDHTPPILTGLREFDETAASRDNRDIGLLVFRAPGLSRDKKGVLDRLQGISRDKKDVPCRVHGFS